MAKTIVNPMQKHDERSYQNKNRKQIRKNTQYNATQGNKVKLVKQQNGLPNLAMHKKNQVRQIQLKTKLDTLQQERLQKLEAKQAHPTAFKPRDLSEYVRVANAEKSKFEDDFVQKGEIAENELNKMSPNERQMAQSRKAYYKILKAVIEESDVVLQVLDARDPMGCRNEEIEQEALKQGKKVLLILNKIDLVPSQNARMWLRYLRQEFPVILFKANQQKQNSLGNGVSLFKQSLIDKPDMVDQMVSASTAVGTENLMNILKNYARISGSKNKKTIYVGVVGFPNVGKSSIINSLKRARAAPTGNTPGVTKSMQEVQLDKNIVLLDSPGVVLSTKEQSDSLILRSAIKVEELEDPIRPVEAIIARIERNEIDELYGLQNSFASTENLLGEIARKKGMVKKGGIAIFDSAARLVIRDYLDGKLPYFTPAPHMEGMDENEEMIMEDVQL